MVLANAVVILLAGVGLRVSLEHRITKLETRMEELSRMPRPRRRDDER